MPCDPRSPSPFLVLAAVFLATVGVAGPALAEPDPVLVKLGTAAPDGTATAAALEALQADLTTAGDGAVRVKLYLHGVFGDGLSTLQKVRRGPLHGGAFTAATLATHVPELQLFDLPFLFRNPEEVAGVLEGGLRARIADLCTARDLHLLTLIPGDFVDLGSAAGPLTSPLELAGVHARVEETEVQRSFWTALGASPTPLLAAALPAKLKAGTITAYAETAAYAVARGWPSQTRHWTDSNHAVQPVLIVLRQAFWNELAPDVRAGITAAAARSRARAGAEGAKRDEAAVAALRAAGVEVHTLTPTQRAALEEKTAGVAAALVSKKVIPAALLDRVRTLLQAVRKP